MYRSALASEVGGYPLEVKYSQDYSLIRRIVQRSEIGMIESLLCKHRSSAGSMTQNRSLRLVRAEEELQQLWEEAATLRLSPAPMRRNRHKQAVSKLKIGLVLLGTSWYTTGATYIMSALLKSPSALIANGFIDRHIRPTR